MIDLWAARLLTGNYLTPVTTAEALIFPLLGHLLFGLLLHSALTFSFLRFHFLSCWLVLYEDKEQEGHKAALLVSAVRGSFN